MLIFCMLNVDFKSRTFGKFQPNSIAILSPVVYSKTVKNWLFLKGLVDFARQKRLKKGSGCINICFIRHGVSSNCAAKREN